MAFDGYSIMVSNIFDTSKRENTDTDKLTRMFDIVRNIIKRNNSGDVIMVFEEDTEDSGYLIYSWFNDPCYGWKRDYDETDIELATLENVGFFDC